MNRTLLIIAATLLAVLLDRPGLVTAGDLLSPVAAERLGLVESWHRQLGTIGGASSIIDLQVWTQHNKQREYIEIVRADQTGKALENAAVLRRIPVDLRDSSGVVIGKAEAERLAKLDVLKLSRRGIPATIRTTMVKQVRLYMLGSDGGVVAYDAESGETLWTIRIGNPLYGYGSLGISDGHVTVINGTTLYRIIADERQLDNSIAVGGRPLEPVRLDTIPILGPVNTDSFVVVANIRQGLECYSYNEVLGEPSSEMFSGQALAKPARYPVSSKVGWTTDQGYFYLMETEGRPSTLFRLRTDGNVNGGVTPGSGDRFFFGSSGGRVYGILATRSGEVLWNRSLGEPFYKAPFVDQESVLLASSYGNLYNLSAKDGKQQWSAPAANIDTVFARAGDQYFARTASGALTVLTRSSGQQTTLNQYFIDQVVTNHETDRVYLVSDGGMIQCLRPSVSELPTYYRDAAPPVAESAATEVKPKKEESTNPFGVAEPAAPVADPFGAGTPASDPFSGGADPFGGGTDPFGAGGDAGGGADPFK